MKKQWRAAAILALAMAAGGPALAADSYDLFFYTIDDGGYTFCTGGGYALGGTIGQPDAAIMTGGEYSLQGGFWTAGLTLASVRVWMLY